MDHLACLGSCGAGKRCAILSLELVTYLALLQAGWPQMPMQLLRT